MLDFLYYVIGVGTFRFEPSLSDNYIHLWGHGGLILEPSPWFRLQQIAHIV